MKTPKRTPWQHSTQPCLKADGELRCTITEQATRWKRKNRVKQLKRTIERYKRGTMLDGQFDLYIAYKWLQRLKMPSKDADSRSWKDYRYKLGAIRGVIVSALMESEELLKKALEREQGKEQ